MTLAGIGLFYSAPRLCRNVFFHYTTGVGVGMAFSLLLLCYLAQRKVGIYCTLQQLSVLFARMCFQFSNTWAGWLLGMYSLSLYFLTSLWYNLKIYLVEHHTYVLSYLIVTGLASFAAVYRFVSNDFLMSNSVWKNSSFPGYHRKSSDPQSDSVGPPRFRPPGDLPVLLSPGGLTVPGDQHAPVDGHSGQGQGKI